MTRAADEELMGSWASVTFNLVAFLRSKGLSIYDKLADALDAMAVEDGEPEDQCFSAVASLLSIYNRSHTLLADVPQREMDFATSVVPGERVVEVSGKYSPLQSRDPCPT
jgi:hypothetical protein